MVALNQSYENAHRRYVEAEGRAAAARSALRQMSGEKGLIEDYRLDTNSIEGRSPQEVLEQERKYVEASGRAEAARSALRQMEGNSGRDRAVEAAGRAEAARSALRQIEAEYLARNKYNSDTVAVLGEDGRYHSWASDRLDSMAKREDTRAEAKALWAKDIYERHLKSQQEKEKWRAEHPLIPTAGKYINAFGKGVYSALDGTIDLTGKVVGPVYREAVRPTVSAIRQDVKGLLKEILNTCGSAAKTLYNGIPVRNREQGQRESREERQRTPDMGDVIDAEYEEANPSENSRSSERAERVKYSPKGEDESSFSYVKRRAKEEWNNFRARTGWYESKKSNVSAGAAGEQATAEAPVATGTGDESRGSSAPDTQVDSNSDSPQESKSTTQVEDLLRSSNFTKLSPEEEATYHQIRDAMGKGFSSDYYL